jgi:PAS domain-containing protein
MSDSDNPSATGELFQALVEHSSDAIVLVDAAGKVLFLSQTSERLLGHPIASASAGNCDPSGRFTYVNPSAERVMKFSQQELLGRHFL